MKEYDAVSMLLSEKADQTIPDQYGMLPFHYAVRSGCMPIVKMLMKAEGSAVVLEKFYDGESCFVLF